MKVLFLTNNLDATRSLLNWLINKEDEVTVKKTRLTEKYIESYEPDLVISYNYSYIIKENVIKKAKNIINLHISYLPWNKGADPNVWSWIEDTPKGVTIHKIDPGIDTGNILLQKKVNFNGNEETLSTSYDKLHNEIQDLFKNNWDKIKYDQITPKNNPDNKGTFHYAKEFNEIKDNLLKKDGWDITIPKLKENYVKEIK